MSFRIVYLHLTSANSKVQGHVFFDCEYVRNDNRNSTYYHCHQIETPIYSIDKICSPSNFQPNSQSLTLNFKVKLWTFKFMLLQRLNRNFTFCTLLHIEYRSIAVNLQPNRI